MCPQQNDYPVSYSTTVKMQYICIDYWKVIVTIYPISSDKYESGLTYKTMERAATVAPASENGTNRPKYKLTERCFHFKSDLAFIDR